MLERVELILFRAACLGAVGIFLFCMAAFVANAPEERNLPLLFAFVGPAVVMITYYSIRWVLTGRLKPLVPN